MLRLAVIVFAASLLSGAASASDVTVIQNHVANVYGAVQVGGVQSITVRQTGTANIVGTMQVGGPLSLSASQTGARNSANVSQINSSMATSLVNSLRNR